MGSQPRIVARTARARTPAVAPALRPTQSLFRLLIVALATALVVLVWGQRDDAPPPAAAAGGPTAPAARVSTSEIIAPAGAPAAAPVVDPGSVAERASRDLPRLQPNALPRPPEPPDPLQPARFDRYTVTSGDAIFNIALARGIEVEEILRYNPTLGDDARIDTGDVIFIPAFDSDEP